MQGLPLHPPVPQRLVLVELGWRCPSNSGRSSKTSSSVLVTFVAMPLVASSKNGSIRSKARGAPFVATPKGKRKRCSLTDVTLAGASSALALARFEESSGLDSRVDLL